MFILQCDQSYKNGTDYAIIKDLLKNSHFDYAEMKSDDFYFNNQIKYKKDFPTNIQNGIPIGDIKFTTTFLKIFKNIDKINPIEVPQILRTDEFLKRKYAIIKGDSLPQNGRFFVKNASSLKDFTFVGDIADLKTDIVIDKNEYYLISEIVDIFAEYRIYFLNGKIYAIAYYNGNPCIFPDIKFIQKANLIYSTQKEYPKSYTMDIMVNNKGTSIVEVHLFFSCGLYQTVIGIDFLQGYLDAMKYVENFNTPPIPFHNFIPKIN